MYIFTYDGFYITIKICLTIYIITVGFLFLVHALTNVANTEYLINVENIQLNTQLHFVKKHQI